MPFGVNLSFAVKRWITPDLWAPLVREDLGLDLVQFSFDLVDPTWPDALLDALAADIRRETKASGVVVHSAFIGLAHYTFNQLLHPDARVRDVAEAWLERAYRFAALAGVTRVGGPLGAVAARRDAREAEAIPAPDYEDLIARLRRLGEAARREGVSELYVEPTPLRREWPWTVAQALTMARDLKDCATPWKFCLDWGHGTFEPLYGRYRAGMAPWFEALGGEVGIVHLQQTDFLYDRHWDFTQTGLVDPAEAARLQRAHAPGAPTFLEAFYPFERDDQSVLAGMRGSVDLLKAEFS